MRCPQFSMNTLLWLMPVLAAFLGGLMGGTAVVRYTVWYCAMRRAPIREPL